MIMKLESCPELFKCPLLDITHEILGFAVVFPCNPLPSGLSFLHITFSEVSRAYTGMPHT